MVFMTNQNLNKNLVLGKVYHLVYLSGMMKAYLKVTFWELIQAMMNKYHLVYLNETLKDLAYLNELLSYLLKDFTWI